MNKILLTIILILFLTALNSWGQLHLTTADEISLSGRCLDSSGFYISPDSVRLVVYHDGAEEFDSWYDSSDAQCSMINEMLVFTETLADIDNDSGDGLYEVMAGFFEDDGDLYNWKSLWVYIGVDMSDLASIESKVDSCLDSLRNLNDWVAHQTTVDSGYFLADTIHSAIDTIIDSLHNIHTEIDNIYSDVTNLNGWSPLNDNDSLIIDFSSLLPELWQYDTSNVAAGIGRMLKDTSAYQGGGASLDSGVVYGAVLQVLEDSTAKYQGGASGLDSNTVYRNVLRANRDSGFVIHDTTSSGYYVNPFIGLGDTTFARIKNVDDYLKIPNGTASCESDSSVGVHPSVVYIPDSIGVDSSPDSVSELSPRFTFLMSYSPFGGGGELCGNQRENPCILGSYDGDNWVIPFYIDSAGDTTFAPNPLVNSDYFDCEHLSDAKLMFARDTLYCYYRAKWMLSGDSTVLYCQTSVDAVNWSDTIRVKKVGSGSVRLMSPVIFEEADSSFTLIYVDDSSNSVNRIVRLNADEPAIAFDTCAVDTLNWIASQSSREIWHLDIERYNNSYHAFVTESDTGGGQYTCHLGISSDGLNYFDGYRPCLTAGSSGNWDDGIIYKMCGLPCNNRREPYYDIWYSAMESATGDYHIGHSRLRFIPPTDANVMAVSDDMVAAEYLERALDGRGGVQLTVDLDGYLLPGVGNNLVTNGSFEADSVIGSNPPEGWTIQSDSMTFTFAGTYNNNQAIGHFYYRLGNWSIDTVILSQYLGYLDAGVYALTAKLKKMQSISDLMIVLYDSTALPTKGFVDSLMADTVGFIRYTQHMYLDAADNYTLGVVFYPNATLTRAWIDDIRLERVEYYSPGASGTGAKSYTIFVADTTNTDTLLLPGVVVSAYSMSGELQAGMKSDSFGKVKYATSLDSLILVVDKLNIYADPDTIVIDQTGQVDTLFVNHGTIPTSGSPDLCRVYGFLYDISGNPDANATVTAWLPSGVCRADSTIISPFKIEAGSDELGYFYLDLIPSGNLVPDTTKYEITIARSDGTILRERIAVPDSESWLLTW